MGSVVWALWGCCFDLVSNWENNLQNIKLIKLTLEHCSLCVCFLYTYFLVSFFCFCLQDDSTVSKTVSTVTETKSSGPAKVTITKVFDFAGEEVR